MPGPGAQSGGPHGAAGAATPPIVRDAHVGPDVEGDEDAVLREGVDEGVNDGRSEGSKSDLAKDSKAGQSTRQGRQFALSKRVPVSSLLRDEAFMADEGSDSSEDERPPKNTVGDVPLEWYQHEEHIGYDRCVIPASKSCFADQCGCF